MKLPIVICSRLCNSYCHFVHKNVIMKSSNSIKIMTWQSLNYSTQSHTEVLGKKYECDQWTNVTPKIISHVGRNLHHQKFHPLNLIKEKIVNLMYSKFVNARGNPLFSVYDNISPIVTIQQNFDSLLIPKDHASRKKSDTYYLNERLLLRSHTSAHQWELIHSGLNNFLVFGDVYRRDEIDTTHYPVFHQMEGVRIGTPAELNFPKNIEAFENGARTSTKQEKHTQPTSDIVEKELKLCVEDLAKQMFGFDVKIRWTDTVFPFTHPSWELEVLFGDEWVEMLGCGIIEQKLLENAGAGDKIGWAFGFGLERVAMKLYRIPDIRIFWSRDTGFLMQFEKNTHPIIYKPISVYPQLPNDISFWIPDNFISNDFYDIVRNIGGDLIEQVKLIDQFENKKLKKISHCYRIVYRHMERTLTQKEISDVHERIEETAKKQLLVEIR